MSRSRVGQVAFQPGAGAGVQRGIRTVAAMLAPTLGPTPRVVAIASPTTGTRAPELLDDGGVIARRMVHLADREADTGAMLLRDALLRVHDLVGDGVATTAVLVQTIHDACVRAVAAGCNPMRLREGLEEGLAAILDHLSCQTVAATDRDTLRRVARTACADDELATSLVDVFDVVGEYGQIEVRTGQVESLRYEILDGGFWDSRALTRSSLTELPGRRLDVVRPAVFVSDLEIDDPHDLVPLLRAATASGAGSLLMIVAKVSDAGVNLLTANHRPEFPVLAMRTPESARGPESDAMEDLAVLTGARMFRAAAGDRCAQVEPDDLGHARRGWADLSHFGLIGPAGDARGWQQQVTRLEGARRRADDLATRSRYEQRIARLTGATAVISVNGISVPAIEARKELVRRSERTVRSALQDGAVPGGGVALLACREPLARLLDQPGDADRTAALRALMSGLEAPVRTLARNAGFDPSVVLSRRDADRFEGDGEESPMDSAAVVSTAIRVAVGTAAEALTIGAIIHPRKPEDVSMVRGRRS